MKNDGLNGTSYASLNLRQKGRCGNLDNQRKGTKLIYKIYQKNIMMEKQVKKIFQKTKKQNKNAQTVKILAILIPIYYILFSCSKPKQNDEWVSLSNPHSEYQLKLKEKIICEGDTIAYLTLTTIYDDDGNTQDLLAYSLIMANKYDYLPAYYDVFRVLNPTYECSESGLNYLDEQTRSMALFYFKQAIHKGNKYASKILLELYDKDKEFPIKELYSDKELMRVVQENIRHTRADVSSVCCKEKRQ